MAGMGGADTNLTHIELKGFRKETSMPGVVIILICGKRSNGDNSNESFQKLRVNPSKPKLSKELILNVSRLYYQKEVSNLLKVNSPMLLRLLKKKRRKEEKKMT